MINKLMGFYELKDSSLPTIDWEKYTGNETLSDEYLWTIRTAVFKGDDFNLPRFIGVQGREANDKAKELYNKFKDRGMVIYYPFFIAEKSGTLHVFNEKVVIEAVKDDLWNLVSNSNVDVTLIKEFENDTEEYIGNRDFLSPSEIKEIISNIPKVKRMFRDEFNQGKSVLLEWSFAFNCDKAKMAIGNKYLIFYEARTI